MDFRKVQPMLKKIVFVRASHMLASSKTTLAIVISRLQQLPLQCLILKLDLNQTKFLTVSLNFQWIDDAGGDNQSFPWF